MNEKTVNVSANSNWHASGCDCDHAIRTRITCEDIYIKPELDEILSEKYAVLLTRPTNTEDACEMQINVCPRYKISSITFVCSAAKVELFFGPLMEYIETIYGALISDDNDEPLSYRYDIEVEKSGVVDITVKMPTASNEICFFGILLQIAPNPNGVTTLMPGAINLDHVQEMLDSSKQRISPRGSEKCKMFMQMLNKCDANSQMDSKPSNLLLDEMRHMFHKKSHSTEMEDVGEAISSLPHTLDTIIKTHIDTRISDLEKTIKTRLDHIEKQQNEKLDRILDILKNKY